MICMFFSVINHYFAEMLPRRNSKIPSRTFLTSEDSDVQVGFSQRIKHGFSNCLYNKMSEKGYIHPDTHLREQIGKSTHRQFIIHPFSLFR